MYVLSMHIFPFSMIAFCAIQRTLVSVHRMTFVEKKNADETYAVRNIGTFKLYSLCCISHFTAGITDH